MLEALFLVAYDHAASALGGDQQWSRYMNMHWFGADGLRSLPGQGASTIPPDWREMFDIERDGHSAYSALWEVRDDCLRDGFEHAHIADALLRRALTEIGACSESGQRYWFRQFAEIGEKAAGRARPPAA